MTIKFAKRMDDMKASEIREFFKLTMQPEIISFAGGLPAPELFPIEEMKKVSQKVLDEHGQKALQYSTIEGYISLREKIVDRMKKFKIKSTVENILITSGSQQGLDFTGKIFLDPDDVVVCERPSYLGAINAFKAYECKFAEVNTDDDGMVMEDLERVLSANENSKLIYVIPDFQNPTGRTLSAERRKQLYKIAQKYNLPIIEDNPYGELRFEGDTPASVKSFDEDGRVIYMGSFSKTFCPGLRLAWVCASEEMLSKYIVVKQAADLNTSAISQMELNEFLEMYDLDQHIEEIKKVYRRRRDLMLKTMKENFPKECKFTNPKGGIFTWVELPDRMDSQELLKKAVEKKVAFVPGRAFFPNGGHKNAFRLNYSNMPEDKIIEGIKRLAEVLKEELK